MKTIGGALIGFCLLVYTLHHPAPLGRGCLNGQPGTCGLLALGALVQGNPYQLGSECLKGTPMTCGLLSGIALMSK